MNNLELKEIIDKLVCEEINKYEVNESFGSKMRGAALGAALMGSSILGGNAMAKGNGNVSMQKPETIELKGVMTSGYGVNRGEAHYDAYKNAKRELHDMIKKKLGTNAEKYDVQFKNAELEDEKVKEKGPNQFENVMKLNFYVNLIPKA